MADEAVLDAPEVEEVELGTESTEGTEDQATESTESQSQEQTRELDTAPVITDANGQLKLSQTARERLDKIKAEDPKFARDVRAALFDRQALLAKVPGGVKEALATIEAYEAEGGSEAVQQVKQELELWKGLDADFQAGDLKFVEDIAKGNPEAFAKLAPSVMAKFAELDNARYSHEVAKVFASDMVADEVPLTMKLFRREIEDPANPGQTKPGLEGVAEIYNALSKYVSKITGLAKTAPAKQQTQNAANPTGNSELEQREKALTIREFSTERSTIKEKVTSAEFAKNAGARKIPAEKVSVIQELYETALNRMVQSIPGHTAKVDRFLAAKDKAGYRKHMEAAIRSKAPEAMSQAFRKAGVGANPGPAPKTAAKSASAPRTAATAATGFTRVGTKPDHNKVNWTATARIPGKQGGDGKFIMRDGSRVLYQR